MHTPHPMDQAVESVVKNADMLSEAHIRSLYDALPARTKEKQGGDLKTQIDKMLKLLDHLQNVGMGSSDIDEIKKIMGAGKDLVNLLIKYKEQSDAENRQVKVENAMMQSFQELGKPELTKRFLELLHKKLAEIGAK